MQWVWAFCRFVEYAVTESENKMRGCVAAPQLYSETAVSHDVMGSRNVVVFLSS